MDIIIIYKQLLQIQNITLHIWNIIHIKNNLMTIIFEEIWILPFPFTRTFEESLNETCPSTDSSNSTNMLL